MTDTDRKEVELKPCPSGHKISNLKYMRKRNKENPWLVSYYGAKGRCENRLDKRYKYYGGRGIKFLMTIEDFKTIWFRDKANLMKKPSIDRINNDGNYHLNNCRFIELRQNCAHRGINHHDAKLSNEQVLEMRKNYKFRVNTHKMLARIYGISPRTVEGIIRRKTWRHI